MILILKSFGNMGNNLYRGDPEILKRGGAPSHYTVQNMKFSIKGFFNKYDQIRRNLILSHLL